MKNPTAKQKAAQMAKFLASVPETEDIFALHENWSYGQWDAVNESYKSDKAEYDALLRRLVSTDELLAAVSIECAEQNCGTMEHQFGYWNSMKRHLACAAGCVWENHNRSTYHGT